MHIDPLKHSGGSPVDELESSEEDEPLVLPSEDEPDSEP